MGSLLRDVRFAARMLIKNPAMTTTAVVTLALGIGLTTAMFGIVHGALADLPFEEGHRLVHLERNNPSEDIEGMEVTLHDWEAWRQQQTSFESLPAFTMGTMNLAERDGDPERFDGAWITPDAFSTLRVEAQRGRVFSPDERGPTAPPIALVSHDVWRSRWGADPDVVGRTVRVNGEARTIVGVMPEDFRFPENQDLWLPLEDSAAEVVRGEGRTLEVFGRLLDGVSPDQAALEMNTIAARLAEEHPETNEGVGAKVQPYIEEFIGDEARGLLYTMLGAVFGVLLIACANVANLLLARTMARGREVAIRSALGAGRFRLVSQLLIETLLLAVIGSTLGLALAAVGLDLTNKFVAGTEPPYWLHFGLDPTVVAFALGLAVVTTLVAGLVPALRASKSDAGQVLSEEGRGASAGRGLGRLSRALVVAEVAGSCALLVVAGLMVKSIVEVDRWDHGFETEGLFTARIGLFETDYPEADDRNRFFDRLHQDLAEIPAVEGAALATQLPVGWAPFARFETPDTAGEEPERLARTRTSQVTDGFFETLGAEVLEGRTFDRRDRSDGRPVAVVNRPFAERFFPEGGAVGSRLRLVEGPEEEPVWRTVVGIVPDLSMGGPEEENPQVVYVPLAQTDARFVSLLARPSTDDPMAVTSAVRTAVAGIDPDLPIYWVRTQEDAMHQALWHFDFFGGIFLVFGAASLLMAAVGLYGVMAFNVGRRTREVGIRMALGASSGEVLGLVLRQGAWQIGLGLLIGVPLALGLGSLTQLLLFRVTPWDPTVLGLILVVLAGVGMLAVLMPARRAARVDPLVALRAD